MQSLGTLIPSVRWEPLEHSLPVVTVLKGGFQWISVKIGDDWGPLERSLPVVTVLRRGFQWISFKIADVRGPLKRSLPVVTVLRGWDFNGFLSNLVMFGGP